MTGETNLNKLLKTMQPRLNPGDYVFCIVKDLAVIKGLAPDGAIAGDAAADALVGVDPAIDEKGVLMTFREEEGYTLILAKDLADQLKLEYSFIASWITLTVHSSLEAVGLTAAFATALSEAGISCNVVAAFYHDHIFLHKKDTERAMAVLHQLSN